MDSYQQQAEGEMWDAIAEQERRPTAATLDDERAHWIAVAAGETNPRRDLYKPMPARFASACDGCPRRVRRGESILYSSLAPKGSKVYHAACFPEPEPEPEAAAWAYRDATGVGRAAPFERAVALADPTEAVHPLGCPIGKEADERARERFDLDRDQSIAAIRAALRERSGKAWSVTGGRGTAWGWIDVASPPARRDEFGRMTDADRAELAALMGLGHVDPQGLSLAADDTYRAEYVARARGETPTTVGVPYWD